MMGQKVLKIRENINMPISDCNVRDRRNSRVI